MQSSRTYLQGITPILIEGIISLSTAGSYVMDASQSSIRQMFGCETLCRTEEPDGTVYDMNCVYEKRVWTELKNLTRNNSWIEGQAVLIVFANYGIGWSGSILDSGFDSVSIGHDNTATLFRLLEKNMTKAPPDRIDRKSFICESGGSYSVTVQADDELTSYFGAAVVQDGRMLDLGVTGQDYGVISLTGGCI